MSPRITCMDVICTTPEAKADRKPSWRSRLPASQNTGNVLSFSLSSFRLPRPRKRLTHVAPVEPSTDTTLALRDEALASLLSAAARGDAQSFERFYNRTIDYAHALARRVAGGNFSEDVLSDAYFQAWRDVARFDVARGNALSWLLVIVRSRALDRLRAESLRHGGLPGAPDVDLTESEDIDVPGPDTLLETAQSATQLHRAMAKLSSNERWVIALAYFRDLSHSEIAALTSLPLGTVKSLLTRSQQKLRAMLSSTTSTPTQESARPQTSLRPSML
jgi:RNA polymerase sigma-70 factor, ECF subfamily